MAFYSPRMPGFADFADVAPGQAVCGCMMLRFLGFATLFLVAVCLAVGASIALAADGARPALTTAENPALADVYEFDFTVTLDDEPDPEFDEPFDILEI